MRYGTFFMLGLAVAMSGCNQGDERLEEKARIEGRAQAEAELQTQIDNLEKKVEVARAEGRAQAESELQTQLDNLHKRIEIAKAEARAQAETELRVQLDNIDSKVQIARAEGRASAQAELQAQLDNIDLLVQKARAEGRAQAEAQINSENNNLAAKAQQMEADLANRQIFYQAVKGTYEGDLTTERGSFNVRINLIPSLPPNQANRERVRQLDEIAADINNLNFHAQIVQWNPANRLSAVGCRVESIRPDILKGEISIASSSCPSLYRLKIVDPEIARNLADTSGTKPSDSDISVATAHAIQEGKISDLPEIQGEVHPTTNAAIYKLVVKRASR